MDKNISSISQLYLGEILSLQLSSSIFWLGSIPIVYDEKILRKNFREAVKKGVDIINVSSYKCVRDSGGAPDIEYALYNPSKVLPVADEAEERDLLKMQVEIAHEEGLHTRTYLNVHWYGDGFYRRHKDWVQIRSDESSIDNLYGHGYSMCVNTGYRDRIIDIILEVARRGVDIIFLDGPAYYPGACYCKKCRELFMKEYGANIPLNEDWKDPLWRRFVRFRYKSLNNFLIDAGKALRRNGFKTLLYSNTSGQTWPVWQFALSMEDLWEGEDILAAESYQYYRPTIGIPPWLYGWTAKFGSSVKRNKPFCLFLSHAHAPWVYYGIPNVERRIATFQGIANNSNILEYSPVLDDLVKITKKWSKYFTELKSKTNIGLIWSRRSADYIYDEPTKFLGEVSFEAQAVQVEKIKPISNIKDESLRKYVEEVRGFYEILLRLNVPFDLIGDKNIDIDVLRKYDLIIMPSTVCIGKSQVKALKKYLENGGNIIASYKIGLRNEYGDPYNDSILSEIFGLKFLGKIYGPLPWDYIKIVKKHPIFDNIPKYARRVEKIIPSPQYCLVTSLSNRDNLLALQMKHIASRYKVPEELTDYPAIIASKYGNGKILYFTGNFGGQYWNYGLLDYIKIIENSFRWMNIQLPLEIDGYEIVDPTIYEGDSWYLIFLANYNYPIRRPFDKIYSLKNIDLRLNIEATPRKVISLMNGREMKFEVNNSQIIIKIPVIREYEIILVEK